MLLVGAAGRHAGKTTLVCSIIRARSRQHQVIGVKVTAVDEGRTACPHGKGCGACTALQGDFSIVEEDAGDSSKDTARMLQSGASRAYWLRARRPFIRRGIAALMSTIGEDAAVVCESTSARPAVEPGLFLIAQRSGSDERKRSACAAWDLADRIVSFDGHSFDLEVDDVQVAFGRWALRREATAIVMAGGSSSRMGTDKALLEIDGTPLIRRIVDQLVPHFKEILISAACPERYAFLGLPVVVDREKGRGPLMGMATALAASSHDLNFVHACDMPVTDIGLLQRLLRASAGYDATVPRRPEGLMEPLFAVYRKGALAAMEGALQGDDGRISRIFDACNVTFLDLPDGETLLNLNTPQDYSVCLDSAAKGLQPE